MTPLTRVEAIRLGANVGFWLSVLLFLLVCHWRARKPMNKEEK